MITSSKEVESSSRKQEGNTSNDDSKIVKASSSSSTSWLRYKDPRIVRVSRTFGGKDRHSKVCTIRGLRDRRVRLSVPTAIQLYDLQDRLGLNQPSKVVDWLLNAAKHEIDELPPLPMLPGNFSLNHQAMLSACHEVGASASNKVGFKMGNSINWEDSRQNFLNSEALLKAKSKEIARELADERQNWKGNEEDKQQSSNMFFHRASNSSSPGMIHTAIPYASLFHLEPPKFPLSHIGSHGFANQAEDLHNLNAIPLQSPLSLSSGSQILLCPTGTTQSFFPSHDTTASMEVDPRQVNHFQMLSSSTQNLLPSQHPISQSIRPFHFSVTSRLLHSHNCEDDQPDKDQEFPCK